MHFGFANYFQISLVVILAISQGLGIGRRTDGLKLIFLFICSSQENHEFRSFMKSKAFRIEDYLPGIFNKNEKSNAEMMEKNQRNSLPSDVDQFQKVRLILNFLQPLDDFLFPS